MKTIRNERYQESYDVETLDNGLRVVIWHKPGYARSLFMMATPLGAMDICQVDEHGTQCVYPAGIAHFLEHKMFEKKDRDVMVYLVYLAACLAGGAAAGKRLRQRRFFWGLLSGLFYFLILFAVSWAMNPWSALDTERSVTVMAVCALGGMLGGMFSA